MKSHFKKVLITFMIAFIATSCQPEKSSSGSSSSDDDTNTTDTVNNNNNGGNSTQVPANCTGTTADGTGEGYSIHQFSLMLAGHQSWMPGTYADSLAQQTMPTLSEASIIFKSDARLRVRLKVKSQPYPTAGEEYCYGRATGQPADEFPYTKLRFRVHLRDIMCDDVDPTNPNNCLSALYLGPRYRTQYIDPVSVNFCSPVVDLGSLRNTTQFGTTIEVEDVKADSSCQANDDYCPAEKIVRAASCWHMVLQVVTDYTQDFKP